MTVEIDPVKFGVLISTVESLIGSNKEVRGELAKHQDAIRNELKASNEILFSKIDGLRVSVNALEVAVSGMKPVCQQHSDDIAKLKERPGRLVEIGSAAIAAVCAAAMWLTKGH